MFFFLLKEKKMREEKNIYIHCFNKGIQYIGRQILMDLSLDREVVGRQIGRDINMY